ncbi:MAG: MobC family plasmid mobilization relaxosome protein [Clostridiales bacterium]|nr:MobC family plasmid mobilization relaxosome protein [Clostridiales bacterium]
MIRNQRLCIQVTAEEKAAIKEKMKQADMTNMSEFIRMAVTVNPIVNIDMTAIFKLSYEINRIGNNINQIAKKANASKHICQSDIDEVKEKLNYINDFITLVNKKAFMSAV